MIKKTMILLLIVTISSLYAVEPGDLSEQFHELVDSWLNNEIDSANLKINIGHLEAKLLSEKESWENLYWLARISLIRGQIYYENDEEDLSVAELERSQELMGKSIAIHEHSDSWRIMSEASSLIMIQKGFGYIILNVSRSQDQAEASLKLDPNNARASLIIAQFLTNAPFIAGGSVKKGIVLLEELSLRDHMIDEDEFFIWLTLSEALTKRKRHNEAEAAHQKAFSIYPNYKNGQTVRIDGE